MNSDRNPPTAAQSVLTDGTRVSVINAPAGSGKTRVLTDTSRAWTTAGLGPVVGITAAQSPATPWPPGSRCHTTPPSSWATSPADAVPAARSRPARRPC